jgi:hypothetical protein
MMFMIGQGERVQAVGPVEQEDCPRCEQQRDFTPQFRYSFGQFDLLFGFVYNRRYMLVCSSCNHGWLLDPTLARQMYDKPVIPFRLRYGLFLLAALAAVIGTAAYVYRHAA